MDEAFEARERAAVTAKSRYHHRGQFAMLVVFVSVVSTLGLAYVVPSFTGRAFACVWLIEPFGGWLA